MLDTDATVKYKLQRWLDKTVQTPGIRFIHWGDELVLLCKQSYAERTEVLKRLQSALRRTDLNALTAADSPRIDRVLLYGYQPGQIYPIWLVVLHLNQLDLESTQAEELDPVSTQTWLSQQDWVATSSKNPLFQSFLSRLVMVLLGSTIYAMGLALFSMPNHLAASGLMGFALVLHYLMRVDVSLFNAVANFPILIYSWRYGSWRSLLFDMVGILTVSFMIWEWPRFYSGFVFPEQFLIVAAIGSGMARGIGLSLLITAGGSMGGISTLAKIWEKRYGWRVGWGLVICDMVVLLLSVVYVGAKQAAYTFLATCLASWIVDAKVWLRGETPARKQWIWKIWQRLTNKARCQFCFMKKF
jgi:uncharacterized membrane protein YczE